jgi:hypothetical protein
MLGEEHLEVIPAYIFCYSLLNMNNQMLETLYSRFFIINPRYQRLWYWLQKKREEIARLSEEKWYNEMHRLANYERDCFNRKIQMDRGFVEVHGYA